MPGVQKLWSEGASLRNPSEALTAPVATRVKIAFLLISPMAFISTALSPAQPWDYTKSVNPQILYSQLSSDSNGVLYSSG